MKTLFSLLFISGLITFNVNSQTIEWLNYNQNVVNLTSTIVKVNSNGEIFRLSESKLDKINQFGTVIKSVSYLPKIVSFDFDSSQNILLLGSFKGQIDVNPAPSVALTEFSTISGLNWPDNFNTALIVIKLDNDLNYDSHFKIDQTTINIFFKSLPQEIKVDNDNGIYITTKTCMVEVKDTVFMRQCRDKLKTGSLGVMTDGEYYRGYCFSK